MENWQNEYDPRQFEGQSTERIVEQLGDKIESDVPFEHRKEITPFLAELKARCALFNGTASVTDLASVGSASPGS